jgi:arginine utilization protein RocB
MINSNNTVLNGIEKDIEEILYSYIKVESYSNTLKEKEVERFFLNYFSNIPYFRNTPKSYGTYSIEEDPLNRSVCYAMLRGKGEDTVVFVHHYDIVSVEDFKLLKKFAFSPKELKAELMKIKDTLNEDVQKDLNENTFLFGRGVCDMKGGGSIQMALMKRYSEINNFYGNIIMIAVPDEENLSIGMRSAVKLLDKLKFEHKFNYKLMINSEPHQRKDFTKGIFSEGSVGKIMPFIYVRGVLAHAGKVFEGLNPLNIMSNIVRKTELNMDLSDVVKNEAAPPPTWLYLRDGKEQYDVSMPLSIKGCLSILTLNQNPQSVLKKIKEICVESFDEVLESMNDNYCKFIVTTNQPQNKLPWKTKVVNFLELYMEAKNSYGEKFEKNYKIKLENLESRIKKNEISMIDSNFELVEFIYEYIDDIFPRVVYGLIPPYYPNVTNMYFDNLELSIKNISKTLNDFTKKEFNQTYSSEYFYTGISDLSYSSIMSSEGVLESLESSMPLFGKLYDIPVDEITRISMPCINIGPWGKDFHKLTERVSTEDLYERAPKIINKAISIVFESTLG